MRIQDLCALAGAGALLVVTGAAVRAQGIAITPTVGVYTQANSLDQLKESANTFSIKRESALALGGNLELGFLRASLNYVSGATVNCHSGCGVSGTSDVGKGKILMGAADAVLRPIPRIVVFQPYALAGIGFKKFNYDANTNVSGAFASVKSNSTAAFHAGLGADLMFGGVGIMAEVTDYMSQGETDPSTGKKQLQHDAYGLMGLRFRLF